MYCKSCGKQIDDDSKFCSFCGTRHNITTVSPEIKRETSERVIRNETPIKPIEEKKTEKKEEIVKKEIVPKYDLTYQKETGARTVGIILIIFLVLNFIFGPVVIKLNNIDVDDAIKFYSAFTVIVRILATIWVVGIAKRQNRDAGGLGVLTFISPAILLIIVGSLKKRYNGTQTNNSKQSSISNNYEQQKPTVKFNENLKSTQDVIRELEKQNKKDESNKVDSYPKSTTNDSKNEIDKNLKNLDEIIADLKKYTKK